MIRKTDVYLLNNSINLWSPVATANTIDMYNRLKPTLWDFCTGLVIIHVGTNDISLNKTRHVITEEIPNLEEVEEICSEKGVPLIWNKNINSKRNLTMSRLHLKWQSNFWLLILLTQLLVFKDRYRFGEVCFYI